MHEKQIEIPLGKRNNYAYGMVLGVEDFNQEFAYLRKRMKLHNLMLIGPGTVTGLEVSVSSDELAESILVNAGAAIDPQGNEIFVTSAVQCPLPEEGDVAYLMLHWAERETDPVPVPGSDGDGEQIVASRVEEYAILKYETDLSASESSGIVLARLKKARGKWKIDKKFRVRNDMYQAADEMQKFLDK
jgi:hypothetical protein